tara:strand:- start:4858 stop:5211 length:354 start_codon:yes stop_codon:yes gene_type:complete
MEGFIRNRVQDPRFNSRPVELRTGREVTRWAPLDTHTVSRVTASAAVSKESYSPKKERSRSPKKKRRMKASGSGSETDSGSDNEVSAKKDSGNGRCWKGYKPVPGKKAYSDGSCEKA